MTIYIATILVLFVFSLIELKLNINERQKRILLILSYLILVIQVGLRWETGTDWNSYLYYYEHFNSINDIITFSRIETGYVLLSIFLKNIFDSYTFFLLVHAVIYHYLIFEGIKKLSVYIFPAILMYYVLFIGLVGSNRQLLALGICFYSLRYLLEAKKRTFLLANVLAFFFHKSSLLFLIYYYLNKKFSTKTIYITLVLCFLIGFSSIPASFFSGLVSSTLDESASSKAVYYISNEGNESSLGLSFFGLLKRIVFVVLFSKFSYKFSDKTPYFNLIFNGYLVSVIFYFLFAKNLLILVNRGSLYFNIMEPILLSYLVLYFPSKLRFLIICFFLCISFLFFYKSIALYSDLFIPYKGVFWNTDFQRRLY